MQDLSPLAQLQPKCVSELPQLLQEICARRLRRLAPADVGAALRHPGSVVGVNLADVEVPQVQERLARRVVHLKEARTVDVEALPRDDARAARVLRQPRLDVQHHAVEDEPQLAPRIGCHHLLVAVDADALRHCTQALLAVLRQGSQAQRLRGCGQVVHQVQGPLGRGAAQEVGLEEQEHSVKGEAVHVDAGVEDSVAAVTNGLRG